MGVQKEQQCTHNRHYGRRFAPMDAHGAPVGEASSDAHATGGVSLPRMGSAWQDNGLCDGREKTHTRSSVYWVRLVGHTGRYPSVITLQCCSPVLCRCNV